MAALKARNPEHIFWGLGGDLMADAGLETLYHVKDLSVTGFIEVIKHLSFFKRVMADVLSQCELRKPDAAILLDYPGFNIRLGMKLKALGIPVYYYISPQVWAWKKGRVKTMRKFIKRIFVIFPFEEAFYKQQGIPVTFAGHPVVERDFRIPQRSLFFKSHGFDENKPLIALLPGSRRNEMEKHVEPFLSAIDILAAKTPGVQFAMAGLTSLSQSYYEPFLSRGNVKIIYDDAYPMMALADVAIVASGTATLETAFLGTPLVVIYKMAPLSYIIGKLLIDIEHIAMPNLILGDRAVPELIQSKASGPIIASETMRLLSDATIREVMQTKLGKLKELLGKPGCANIIADTIIRDFE
jgi:lipid-A-disaccharide synthase